MTERAEALRALVERVEGPTRPGQFAPWIGNELIAQLDAARLHRQDMVAAQGGSLDAVARLEAPLIERGWRLHVKKGDGRAARARLFKNDREHRSYWFAPTEARARLLAVLKALLWEEERA